MCKSPSCSSDCRSFTLASVCGDCVARRETSDGAFAVIVVCARHRLAQKTKIAKVVMDCFVARRIPARRIFEPPRQTLLGGFYHYWFCLESFGLVVLGESFGLSPPPPPKRREKNPRFFLGCS